MKLNITPDSNSNSFVVIVNININGDDYSIGRLKFKNTNQWEDARKKIEDEYFHPTDEFCEIIKKKIPYCDLDDIYAGNINFIFVDSLPTIEL